MSINNVVGAGSSVVPPIGPNSASAANIMGVAADVAASPLINVEVEGMYRLSAYVVITSTGTGDTFPDVVCTYADETGANQINLQVTPASLDAAVQAYGSAVLYCVAGAPLTFSFNGGDYSNGLIFNAHFVVEAI